MSKLVSHAEFEMKRVGLDKPDSDYDGMLYDAVLRLVKCFADDGHSGFSAMQTLKIFMRVAQFKTLSPITNDPSEWSDVSDMGGPDGKPVFQNRRDSACFSNDGGKTYYSVDDEKREVKVAQEATT